MTGRNLFNLACAGIAILHSTTALLTIPSTGDTNRTAAVAAIADQIANVDRGRTLEGNYYPLIPGPALVEPSLYYTKMSAQLKEIALFGNPVQKNISAALAAAGPYSTAESFKAGYEALEKAGLIEIPQALDNSDEMFGEMRLGVKGHNLRLVKCGEWEDPLNTLSDALVCEQCDAPNITIAIQNHLIFVEDFSAVGQFTDTNKSSSKYTPNVVGFFCNNTQSGLLLPLAIKLVDTELTYTKEDSTGEWQLAKMALDSSELNFRQTFHFVQTHLVYIPIQVEMMRSMADWHPVYALLDYHFFGDFAVEYLANVVLLSTGTPYDQSAAYGATGFLRSVLDELPKGSVLEDYPADIEKRGLKYLPRSRYLKYGGKYYEVFKAFVTAYIHEYYPSETAIQSDTELQTWASRSSQLQGVNDFPSCFEGFDDLIKVVTNLIFQNAVRHHFMNGRVSWHCQAAPFSPAALYNHQLPTEKGVEVNPLDYAIPSELFPVLSYMVSGFYRPIPASVSALQAYTTYPFTEEEVLNQPIADFHLDMESIETLIDETEAKEARPFAFIKPSLLPWFSYV